MTIEEKLKEYILVKYKSIREFTLSAGIPYSTVDAILKLEQELDSLEEEKSEKLSKEEAEDLIQSFDDIIKRANFEEIRSVLSALIEKIVLDGEEIKIFWRF